MVKASRGMMSKRTRKLKGKGRVSVARHVKTFEVGENVILSPVAKRTGLPHLRYAGRNGRVIEKRGKSYVVEVKDFSMMKKIVVGPVHLRTVK